jgi:NadR type nicotinamide-nucleotide adenylyltransferase
MSHELVRIAIVGPESTGKSTLAAALAARYSTVWTPEYARDYIANLNQPYTADDITEIARGQLQLEDEYATTANKILFCDTTLLVTKIWQEHAFGFCVDFIRENLKQNRYTLHLLTNVDIPWEADPQREHPHLRQYFFELYKTNLTQMAVPFVEISGTSPEQRLISATEQIQTRFSNK